MLAHNPIIPNTAKSINSSFRQPPVLQNPQGVDELSYTYIPRKFARFHAILEENSAFYRLENEVDGSLI